jgi:hypothetical protein
VYSSSAQTDLLAAQRKGLLATMAPSLNAKAPDTLNSSSSGLAKSGSNGGPLGAKHKNQGLAGADVAHGGKMTYEQQLSGYSAQSHAQAQAHSMHGASKGNGTASTASQLDPLSPLLAA